MYNEFERNQDACLENTCPADGYQDVTVCLPVEVKPFADVGKIKVKCLGSSDVNCSEKGCCGEIKGKCNFTISQKIRVEVPVTFGADVEVGEARIDCECGCGDSLGCDFKNF